MKSISKRSITMKSIFIAFIAFAIAITVGCSDRPPKAPDVTGDIRNGLDQAGLKDVSVKQDREKGVVTLTGSVASENDKAQAETIAKSVAGSQVVSNEIGIRPNGDESTAKKVDSDLDSAIDENLEAKLVQLKLKRDVRYNVENGVVTLKGDVHSQAQRESVEKMAQQVPNVKQVVNELDVKKQKATSMK
jgi:hyperosmotically inducible periplasmic protein